MARRQAASRVVLGVVLGTVLHFVDVDATPHQEHTVLLLLIVSIAFAVASGSA